MLLELEVGEPVPHRDHLRAARAKRAPHPDHRAGRAPLDLDLVHELLDQLQAAALRSPRAAARQLPKSRTRTSIPSSRRRASTT